MWTLSAISCVRRRASSWPGNAAAISSALRKIELVGLHPHPVRVGAELARVDAQQDVLGLGVLAADVVDVAGGHQRDAHPPGHFDRSLQRHLLAARPLFWISM